MFAAIIEGEEEVVLHLYYDYTILCIMTYIMRIQVIMITCIMIICSTMQLYCIYILY